MGSSVAHRVLNSGGVSFNILKSICRPPWLWFLYFMLENKMLQEMASTALGVKAHGSAMKEPGENWLWPNSFQRRSTPSTVLCLIKSELWQHL